MEKQKASKQDILYKIGGIVSNIAIVLAILSLIALFSKGISIFLIFFFGVVMLAIIVVLAIITVGTIYLSDFGKGLWSTFISMWDFASNNWVTTVAYAIYPYINFISVGLAIASIVLVALSKKHWILRTVIGSLIILILTITFIIYIVK